MSAVCCPDHVSGKKESIMRELLVEGKESASQLKLLFQKPLTPDDVTTPSPSAQQLVAKILKSFTQSISLLTSSVAQISAISGQSGSHLGAYGRREDDSSQSRKRSPPPPPPKDRRGCYKRRKGENTWTETSPTMEDGHAWRKYGQKEILNSKFPRSYFRCTRKHDQGCKAIKQVQRLQENPEMFKTTYIGLHTCKDSLKAPEMVTDCGNWGSYMLPTESNRPLMSSSSSTLTRSPTIKQEYPKEEETSLSEVTDELWSEFKDFELSEPLMKMPSTMDFGVDHSVGFGTDHHLRFQY